jgi:hypothetical protein
LQQFFPLQGIFESQHLGCEVGLQFYNSSRHSYARPKFSRVEWFSQIVVGSGTETGSDIRGAVFVGQQY